MLIIFLQKKSSILGGTDGFRFAYILNKLAKFGFNFFYYICENNIINIPF